MHKNLSLTLTTIMILGLSGCVQNQYERPKKINTTKNTNQWAEQTNVDDGENIDISDLDGNITESELGMIDMNTEQKVKRVAFPTAEYNRYSGVGKGTIQGSIYVTNSYGEKVLGSATRLYLNPATSYSNQWYNDSYIGGKKMEKADSRLYNYLKFTASNSEGKFAFYGVPSGSYYLIGTVKCGSQCGYDTQKSIRIAKKVSVQGNNIVDQDLSRYTD